MRVILARGSRSGHLLTGAYLSGLTLAITTIALTSPARSPYVVDQNISLALIGLVVGIAFALAARLERHWVMIVMIPLGFAATFASASYPPINNAGPITECATFRVNRGFPLPWTVTHELPGSYFCPPPGWLQPSINPTMGAVSFFVDVIFYIAIGLAIIQLFRATTGRTTIPEVFPILSSGKDNHPGDLSDQRKVIL